jgi:hypothetical protein
VAAVFAWYAERLLRRSFHAVRALPGSHDALAAVGAAPGPGLLVMTHASWWDPIVGAFLWRRAFRGRPVLAPMDRRELERFRFMRKLGLFGIDPDDPGSMAAMLGYVGHEVRSDPQTVLMLTPQGRFTDPRDPLVVRPGAAALAARLGVGSAVAVAVEYAFGRERKPEVFLAARLIDVAPPGRVASWQRSIVEAMQGTSQQLAGAVRRRDESRFEEWLGGASSVHPVYDWWLRLRGKRSGIEVDHRLPQPEGAGP